ncbi:MAG: putative transposase [Planctomycetota bacterium]|jgi:putative transposase
MPDIALIVNLLQLVARDRSQLVLENIALRHQLAVYKRSAKRPNINDGDRIFWLTVMRMLKAWREALVFVQPATVVRWHRKGFKHYWRRKSRPKPGRPPIAVEIIHLIRRISTENVTWGAPRIAAELALLGHEVAESTVAKYMVRHRPSQPDQTWKTFLHNHMAETAACDFFVVPTVTFQVLYCFVVMSLDRRRILHVNVTNHPTAEWTARQLVEAFPGDGWTPRYLQRDRDKVFGWAFRQKVKSLGIEELISAPRSPWQNAFVERVIGTLRRECTDHIIPLSEKHLLRTLREFIAYYNESRTHYSLDGNAPIEREVQARGEVTAKPVLGGLHHRYSRAA